MNDAQIRENMTIVLKGNLTIQSGGNLTFRNVTLQMNSTAGIEYRIDVQSGGVLVATDNDNSNFTEADATKFQRYNPAYAFFFSARPGSILSIKNSIFELCGRTSAILDREGVYIGTDNAWIDHSRINGSVKGVILYGSDAVVSNNTIEWCEVGVYSSYWSNGTIENNWINSNWLYGIWVTGGSNGNPKPSNPLIRRNTILNTGRGVNTADGLQIEVSSAPIIKDTKVIASKEDGMFMWSLVDVRAENLTIDPQGGNYAIVGGGSWNTLSLTNSTIGQGAVKDVSISQSYFTFTNTTFHHARVAFGDIVSNLTVQWFLNSYVNDSFGNPIPNANIRISDNVNGTYDNNFTANENGYVNWTALREYYQIQSTLIDYNPYNITVSKPGYSIGYAEVEMNDSKTVVITLIDIENPIADAGLNQTVDEDTTVYLDGSGSTDNVGVVNYTWHFYDGGPLVNLFGVNASYIFAQPGTYTITLNVTDASGNWDSDTCVIYANDSTAPIANAGTDQSVDEDEMVYFDGGGSTDNVGIAWYNWTFGDGSQDFGSNIATSHAYTNAGSYIVTLNVSDAAGNWATDTCLVFVSNIAPTANAGGNKTGNEGEAITFDGSASNDTASDLPTLTYVWYFGDGDSGTGKIVNHAYADNDFYNATLVVTDDNGRVDSDTCNVTVNNVAPVIMPVANQTAQQGVLFTLRINATDVPADVLTFSDNTTLFDINPVTGIIQFTPTNGDVGIHFVNITVTDDDVGSSSIIFKITVNNTKDAPVVAPIPAQSATEDVPFALQVLATDPDAGDNLTYSLTAYPTGMAIASTGLISWTPTNAAVGSHTITVRVRDTTGLYDEKTFAITVANVNDIPTISTSSLANATEDAMYLYPIQANDVDVGDTLTYSLDSAPAFLSINPSSGLLYGTPTNAHVGTHQLIVNVSDGATYVTRAFNLTVINVNDPPTLIYISPQTATEDVPFSLQIVGQDVDVGDILTYSLISSLTGMTVNQATGLIAWTPTNDDVGSHTINVWVNDESGAFAERTFLITVANVNDPPTIIITALSNATEGLMYMATVQAEDIDGDALTFSFDSAPSFLSINAETGLIYGMPTNDDVGVHQIVVNVSDGIVFMTKTFNFTVLNVNNLPVITSYPISVAKPGSEYTYAVIAEDADAGDVLAYSLVEAPEGMTINGQTGKITWTPTDAQAGQTYQVVVRVSDGNGSTTQTYSIAVDDLPAEPYRPLFDDYVWIGIIIMLISIILLLLFYQHDKGRKEKEEQEIIEKMV